jgi:hypothetical protein
MKRGTMALLGGTAAAVILSLILHRHDGPTWAYVLANIVPYPVFYFALPKAPSAA